MNTTTAKPTPGPWTADLGEAYSVTAKDGGRVAIMTNLKGHHGLGGRREGDEVASNVRLIAEAGTVYHETGLTPRQLDNTRLELARQLEIVRADRDRLADQRAELLAALEKVCELVDSRSDYTAQLRLAEARAAIARAKAVSK